MMPAHVLEELNKLSEFKKMKFYELTSWTRGHHDNKFDISYSAYDSMLKMVQNMDEPVPEPAPPTEEET